MCGMSEQVTLPPEDPVESVKPTKGACDALWKMAQSVSSTLAKKHALETEQACWLPVRVNRSSNAN